MTRLKVRGTRRALLATIGLALALGLLVAGTAEAAAPNWRVLAVTGPTNLPPSTSEVQSVAVDAEAGTFTLSFESPTGESSATGELPFDLTATTLESALNALPSIANAGGNVAVTGGPGNAGAELPYYVSFRGALAGVDVAELGADGSGLSGGSHTAAVATETPGSPAGSGELAVFATNAGGAPTAGTVTLTVDLPAGITTSGEGHTVNPSSWSCPSTTGLSMVTCAYAEPVAAIKTAPVLVFPLAVDGSLAASASHATVTVEGGVTTSSPVGSTEAEVTVSAAAAKPGIQAMWAGAFSVDGQPETQAGGHPYSAITAFQRTTVLAADGRVVPAGDLRDIRVDLPTGFLANPLIMGRCPDDVPIPVSSLGENLLCNESSQVGGFEIWGTQFGEASTRFNVYNDVPPPGYPAEFGTEALLHILQRVLGSVRSGEDFGATAIAPRVIPQRKLYGNLFAFEGYPAAAGGKPLLTNPTDCALQAEQHAAQAGPLVAISNSTWQEPDTFGSRSEVQPAVTGCQALTESWLGEGPEPKKPSFEFQPTVTQGSSGTGATARLHINQEGLDEAGKLATSALKKTVVTLPQGLSLNPAAANGLQACNSAQIGLKGTNFPMPTPIRFNEEDPKCPEGSKLGTVEATSPLLEEPVKGTIYLAAQDDNPFHSLIALYLVIESPRFGLTVKLAGNVEPDPNTGQLTATFDNNPQLPVEDLTLHFRGGGPQSPLATPEVCGDYKTTGSLAPWSAEHGEAAQIDEAGFTIGSGCSGSAGARGFNPGFEAGTVDPIAGAYSPLVIKVSRKDGEQELKNLEFTLPPGVTGKLAGVPYCSDAAIAAAAAKSGTEELSAPSCPDASRLGSVDTAAGVGSEPIHVGGSVYLSGPYEGAPISAVVITPAVAGPFDLGTVVVRTPLFVNPETAQITAKSDEIPHILKGIPLQLRSVEIQVTRQGFTLNPTSCDPMTVTSGMSGLNGGSASPSSRFQVGGCDALAFKPQLKLSVLGKTARNAKPRLKAVLTAKPGEANIARAQVNLPHSEFLEQSHIKEVCTRVQFAQGDGNGSACPPGSVYGHAKAWSPLLDQPLEGNVYLRSNGGERELPDLVAALDGQIDIALWGKVDSGPNEGLRNTFEVVPDAPVSRFVLEMNGGSKGLLVNSENLCSKKAKRQAIVRFTAQNGKVRHFKPTVANSCKKKGKRAAEKSSGRHAAKRSQAQVASLLRRLHTGW